MPNEQALHLFVIDDSSNDAETISNMLRNAGQAVHTTHIEDDEDLREALHKQPCDLIIAKPNRPYLSLAQTLTIVQQHESYAPILMIGDGLDDAGIDAALQNGVRDVVSLAQPSRLLHAVLRESATALEKRQLAQCMRQLEENIQRAQLLVDSSRDAIAYIHDGMHVYTNHSYLEMFGYSSMDELEGMPILDMVQQVHHAEFKSFLRDYTAEKAEKNRYELAGLRADGKTFDIIMELSRASYDGEPCTQIIIRAQENTAELERRLQDMSKLDLLTGIYNRQYFLEQLQAVIGQAGMEGAVLYLHPDHFKAIREAHGLAASDQLLSQMAKALSKAMGDEKYFIARFEGEFFCALLTDADQKEAERVASRLCLAVDQYGYAINGKHVDISCSIGIAFYNEGIKNAQELLLRADKAMREANRQGGNCHHLYVPDAGEMAEKERLTVIIHRLKEALRKQQLYLVYQPVVSIKGDERENYEAFVRVEDEDGSALSAGEFIPAAEKGNLMPALDRWIVAHTIKTATEHRRQGRQVVLYTKISAASVRDEKFLPWLLGIIEAAKAEPNSLVIEVSESVVKAHLKQIRQLAEGLAQHQIPLAIDHLGRADDYAAVIQQCRADILRIDASCIAKLASDPASLARVKEITQLAAQHGKQVIANAVEDPHTLAMIYSTGVDYIQGYFLQEPSRELDYDFSAMG